MNNELITSGTPIDPDRRSGGFRHAEAKVLRLEAARPQRMNDWWSRPSLVSTCVNAARPDEGRLDEAQLRHELVLAYADLGGATFALARHGALIDPRLAPRVRRICDLTDDLAALSRTADI
jgi:hypothetical protein